MALTAAELVERFYYHVWNKADETEARRILASDFRFRGSLGPELRGPESFIAYMRSVCDALGDFTCQIEEVIATVNQVAARMTFHGRHRGTFFGIAPSGREIRWSGAAFFKTHDGKIIELWVLGDIDEIRRQLDPQRGAATFEL
ncbi:MAG: ester cyclase [Rhizobiales bacterium]|nr:ester cyclase [Hyphomicrobiales bacterium]